MACDLCGKAHGQLDGRAAVLNCPTWAAVPQPMKDLLFRVWQGVPVARGPETATWIYENCYAIGAGVLNPHWVSYFNTTGYADQYAAAAQDPQALNAVIEERVYMNVVPAQVVNVWNAIQPLFTANLGRIDVVQAKYCSNPAAAQQRRDTIVVYLRNRAAVWRFFDSLSELRNSGAIQDTQLRNETPLGTGAAPDLPGVSTAPQPASAADSFGSKLCDLAGAAYDQFNRPVQLPCNIKFAAPSLRYMKEHGLNIAKPWNRPPQVYGEYPLGVF